MKKISFQIMNVLIKGTPSAIKNALNKLKPDSYVLTKFSYNPKKVDIEDTNIVKAGLTFEDWFEGEYVTPEKISFVSMPDVRFIGLGAGGDGCRSDGSYVFYKDLGATSITQCYKFDEASPFMEEAGEVYGTLIVNVLKSFMDHTWKFRYKSWSTGENCFWAFNSERDKELIAEWKKDDKEIAKWNAGNKKNKFYVDFDFEENNDSYKITEYKGKKKEIDISSYNPDKKIYAIGEYAFSPKQKGIINEKNRSKIVSVKLVEGLEKIEIGSFSECGFLKEIDIPKGVKKIEKNAFLGCESLQTMKIPYSVKEIGESAFEECKSLKKVIIPDGVKVISDSLFANCESLEEVEIPDGVMKIGENAFCGCTSLKTIIMPETVKEIGIGAFEGCKSLTEMKIPEGVTKIYDDTFLGCESLEEVKIPDGVIEIGGGTYYGGSAFGGCTSLETLIIPHSVKRIHDETFYECESLKEIQISSSTKIKGNPFIRCDSLFDKEGFMVVNNILFGIKKEKKKIIIPSYVKEIGYEAFANFSSLKEVIIPDSVRHICSYAFEGCESLETIIIPDSVRCIDNAAFYGCDSLEKIQISSSTKIEGNPFKDCDSLFDKDGFIIINNILFGIKEEKKKIIIPDYVKEIGYEAFELCNSIEEIIIPNSVQCIRDRAFHHCKSLKTVNLPSTLKKIGEFAFGGCKQIKKINIPKGATEIAESAFAGTPLNPNYNFDSDEDEDW